MMMMMIVLLMNNDNDDNDCAVDNEHCVDDLCCNLTYLSSRTAYR